jgi:4-amino-4-deoxy-L-arabinose transferase-like glycosyltransferase
MKNLFNNKINYFSILIFVAVLANSLIFLPKYGARDGWSDIEYEQISINMLEGKGFSLNPSEGETMIREPAYPFFLFLNYKIFGIKPNVIKIEQFILLFLILYLIYKITSQVFSDFVAKIATLITAIVPIFPIYASDLISEIFATSLILLFLWLFIKSLNREKQILFSCLSGLVLGILVLTKSIFIFIPIFLFPLYFIKNISVLSKQHTNKLEFVRMFIFAIGVLLVISPWIYRNYTHFDKLSVADRGGMLFYLHNVKNNFDDQQMKDYTISALLGEYFVKLKNPDYKVEIGEGIQIMNDKKEELMEKEGYDFSQTDKIMMKEAKGLFFQNIPRSFFVGFLELVKVNAPMIPKYSIMFAFPDNLEGSVFERFARAATIIVLRLIWLAIIFMALFGIYISLKEKKWLALPLAVFIVYLNGIIFFLQGVPRFVFPIYPLYFIFFAIGISKLFQRLNAKKV